MANKQFIKRVEALKNAIEIVDGYEPIPQWVVDRLCMVDEITVESIKQVFWDMLPSRESMEYMTECYEIVIAINRLDYIDTSQYKDLIGYAMDIIQHYSKTPWCKRGK